MQRAIVGVVAALALIIAALVAFVGLRPAPASQRETPVYKYRVVRVYPHDPSAFTQGLVIDEEVNAMYEGTGLYGESTLREVDLATGDVLRQYSLPAQYFGEGVALWRDRLIQLTWREGTGFVYDKNSFGVVRQFEYLTEGWGLTHDGKRLIMSDGSASLYFLDPDTFNEVGRLAVRDRDQPVVRLNELEYVKGEIYANIWGTDRIARISPSTGQVTGWIQLDGLLSQAERQPPTDVLNGIAYDAKRDRLFVTGKKWPKLFEIALVPVN